jgi:hypothetical protein
MRLDGSDGLPSVFYTTRGSSPKARHVDALADPEPASIVFRWTSIVSRFCLAMTVIDYQKAALKSERLIHADNACSPFKSTTAT